MIQILGLREYFNKNKQKLMKAEKFFDKGYRAPSVEDIFKDPQVYADMLPEKERYNMYFTVAQCHEVEGRVIDKQYHIPIDIDGLELTDPVTREQLLPVVSAVGDALGIPPNQLGSLFSGNGVQIFVGTKEPITDELHFNRTRDQYHIICKRIDGLLKERGIKGKTDTSVWSAARLMRLPNTLNQKPNKPERMSFVINPDIERLDTNITKLAGVPEIKPHEQIAPSIMADFPLPRPSDVLDQKDGCQFLVHCQVNPNEITEPEWFAMISIVARFPNGRALVHEMSKGHKGYTSGETDAKIDHAIASSGPRTCKNINTLSDKCKECVHFGTDLVSPIAIRGESYISTEETGFYFVQRTEHGIKRLGPDHDGLRKKFIQDHGAVLTVEGTGGIWWFNGKYHEEISRDIIENYAANKFDPLPNRGIRGEFFDHLRIYEVKDKLFFSKSIEGLVNFKNGVLNVDTGEMLKHDREYGFLSCINTDYDSFAVCPMWEKFIEQVVCGDSTLRAILQEFTGYILASKNCKYQKALALFGTGSNGKSVFVNILKKIVSKEGFSSVSLEDMVNPQNRVIMEGKLVNFAEENSYKDAFKNTSVMKNMVTGGDISVKRLYAQPYQYENTTKLVMLFNKIPKTTDDSEGFFRRLLLIPFDAKFSFSKGNVDLDIEQKLASELAGILNWGLEGYKRLTKKQDFTVSSKSEALLEDYRDQANPLNEFIEDYLVFGEGLECSRDEVYQEYRDWCERNGFFVNSSRNVYTEIRTRYKNRTGKDCGEIQKRQGDERKRFFVGISLTNRGNY